MVVSHKEFCAKESVLKHPYKQVKDLRSGYETSDPDSVLAGNLEPLINAYLDGQLGQQ